MRIDSLTIKQLYGYLDIELKFHTHLNFLIGINGSGKTSALNVLSWVLAPSFKRLAQLQFNEVIICYSTGKAKPQKKAIAKRQKDNLIFSISDEKDELLVPIFEPLAEHSSLESRERQITPSEMYERFTIEKKDHPVLKTLLELTGPLYLPLDRRWEAGGKGLFEPDKYQLIRNWRSSRIARPGIIGPVLYLAERYYRERQSELNEFNEIFREQVVESTFVIRSFPTRMHKPWTKAEVSAKKETILRGLQQTGIHVQAETVNRYFANLEKIASDLEKITFDPKNPSEEFIRWLFNNPYVEWIENIIKKLEEHNKKREASLRIIESFLQSVNAFLCDSDKLVRFDPSGEIVIQLEENKTIRADNLSSGETQLLVLFAYLYFAFPEEQEFVVMIDEPELSLHPKWQHQYVEAVTKANPNVQFILATHSPEIVQQYKDRCIEMKTGN